MNKRNWRGMISLVFPHKEKSILSITVMCKDVPFKLPVKFVNKRKEKRMLIKQFRDKSIDGSHTDFQELGLMKTVEAQSKG